MTCPTAVSKRRKPAIPVRPAGGRTECPDLDGQRRDRHRAEVHADRQGFGFARGVAVCDRSEVVRSGARSASGGLGWCQAGQLLAGLPQFPRGRVVARSGRRLALLALDVVPAALARHLRRTGQVHDGVRAAPGPGRERPGDRDAERWLQRFHATGVDGLGNQPGAGRKRRITEAQRSRIIALARSVPPGQLARDAAGLQEARSLVLTNVYAKTTLTEPARTWSSGLLTLSTGDAVSRVW